MPPNLAQVLNTVAHEIRTPLAVSQGYLKLYLDGRLTNADDQRRAFQQTREALGTLATLCNDMSKVSALAETAAPALTARVSAREFVAHVQKAQEVEGTEWSRRRRRGEHRRAERHGSRARGGDCRESRV